jgi:hypothetical protein
MADISNTALHLLNTNILNVLRKTVTRLKTKPFVNTDRKRNLAQNPLLQHNRSPKWSLPYKLIYGVYYVQAQ